MPEMNPLEVIAECLEKIKATSDREQIAHILAETLGALQIDETEDDAFDMLGSAIAEAVNADKIGTGPLLEVWTALEEQRQ
jgi:hypothetical protein